MIDAGLQFDELTLGMPAGLRFTQLSDLSVGTDGAIHLLVRSPAGVVTFDERGKFVDTWRSDNLVNPHGLTIGPDGLFYIADSGAHVVWIFTRGGDVVGHLGEVGRPSDSGVGWHLASAHACYSAITRGAEPFNRPTKVAFGTDSTMFVSDGYGNARIHRFAGRTLVRSWGEPGNKAGQLRLPHWIHVLDDHSVLVTDRENDRINRYTAEGEYLSAWESQRPAAICSMGDNLVVAELIWQVGEHSFTAGPITEEHAPRISVFAANGAVLGRFVDEDKTVLGIPHGLGSAPDGSVYVARLDTTITAGAGLLRLRPAA